jgi:hypothetical protein
VSLSENVEWIVELNQNTLCVYVFSKGCNTGIIEYINLENSGNYKGDDPKGNICMLPMLLQLPPLLMPNYSIYNIEGKSELNKKQLCACTVPK